MRVIWSMVLEQEQGEEHKSEPMEGEHVKRYPSVGARAEAW